MLFLRFRGDIRVDYNKRGAKREKLEKLCVWGGNISRMVAERRDNKEEIPKSRYKGLEQLCRKWALPIF